MKNRINTDIWRTVFVMVTLSFSFFPSLAQPKRGDYRNVVKNAAFYGVVYDDVQVLRGYMQPSEYKRAFLLANLALSKDSKQLAKSIKTYFRVEMDSVVVTYANRLNSLIPDMGLLVYEDNVKESTYSSLHQKIISMKIPKCEGYGIILFANLIDHKKNEVHYDLVFFNRSNMQVVAFNHTEGNEFVSELNKTLQECIYDAMKNY